jgi:hypothetical protein
MQCGVTGTDGMLTFLDDLNDFSFHVSQSCTSFKCWGGRRRGLYSVLGLKIWGAKAPLVYTHAEGFFHKGGGGFYFQLMGVVPYKFMCIKKLKRGGSTNPGLVFNDQEGITMAPPCSMQPCRISY